MFLPVTEDSTRTCRFSDAGIGLWELDRIRTSQTMSRGRPRLLSHTHEVEATNEGQKRETSLESGNRSCRLGQRDDRKDRKI